MFNNLSSDQIAEVARQAQAFIVVFNTDRRVVWVNRFAHGYSTESVVGKLTEEDICEDDRPAWLHNIRSCIDMGSTAAGVVRLLSGNMTVTYRMGPLRDEFGRIIGVVVVSFDTTLAARENSLMRFMFSPTSRAIFDFLRDRDEPVKGAVIGRHLGEISSNGQATTRIRTLLNNLEGRGILRHSEGGYVLTEEFLAVYPAGQ